MAKRKLLSRETVNFMEEHNSMTNFSDDDVGNDFEMIPMFSARDEIQNDDNFEDLQIIEGIEVFEDSIDEVAGVQKERIILLRTGPSVQDYFCKVLDYLRSRLRFRPDNFRAPIELQRTMERLEIARVPISIWQSFINASVQLISMSRTKFDRDTFIDIFIWVLTILTDLFVEHVLLTTVLLIIFHLGAKHLATIISFIYDIVKSSAMKLWEYIERKMEEYGNVSTENCRRYT